MTREQETTTMGAHAARPSEHRPTTVARIAATTLTVAVTGVLGAGTALAHDGSGHDEGHGGHHGGHTAWWEDGHDGHGHDEARAEAERAADRARETVRDALADLGMADAADGTGGEDDAAAPDGWSGDDTEHGDDAGAHTASAAAPAAEPARQPSSGPRTTTQPIAATENDRPTSDVPPAGETETFPIR